MPRDGSEYSTNWYMTDGTDGDLSNEDAAPPHEAIAPQALIPVDRDGASEEDRYSQAKPFAPWQLELVRWLATLNPGRTQREYEKAVRYFFETPGVPDRLEAISFDLLLAYRGSLALRATPHVDTPPTGTRRNQAGPAIAAGERPALEGDSPDDAGDAHAGSERARTAANTPLAPATVNIRLTALRQFLSHCALFGAMPHLTPDRIRAALRRLTADRRRPYAVLAEPEWAQFLEAAQLPAAMSSSQDIPAPDQEREPEDGDAAAPSPWGVPRAVRQATAAAPVAAEHTSSAPKQSLVRSRAGLTGEHTARRDHALLSLALATGLRAIELASLDLSDLSREWHAGREEWWLVLPDAKTKGQRGGRTLPLAPQVMEVLRAYIAESGRSWESAADRATPLFLSRRFVGGSNEGDTTKTARRGARLSPVQIRRIVDRVEAQWLALRGLRAGDGSVDMAADARPISPHALRHSTAIALLEGNESTGRPPASVEHVRGWLGHFDIRTTQGYLAHLEARRHRRPFTLAPPTSSRDTKAEKSAASDEPPDE